MIRRSLGAVLASFVLAAVPVMPIRADTSSCVQESPVETLEISALARQKTYRPGETALVDVLVTDKVTGQPQPDVHAGLLIEGRREKFLHGYETTNAEGRALLRIRLLRSAVKPGWVRAIAAAWDPIDSPMFCTGRYGYREYERLFRIEA